MIESVSRMFLTLTPGDETDVIVERKGKKVIGNVGVIDVCSSRLNRSSGWSTPAAKTTNKDMNEDITSRYVYNSIY